MGVGLQLSGRCETVDLGQTPTEWLEQAAAWLEGHEEEPLMLCRPGQNAAGEPTLFVQIHPCAEDVELTADEAGQVRAAAKTSSVGPGYHIYLCQLIHRLGRHFNIAWQETGPEGEAGDDTGYFFNQDASAVRQEMLRWLNALARIVLENPVHEGSSISMVSMPLGYAYPDEGRIVTPTGPRPLAWFREVADQPTHGAGFFPWWDEGLGASFFLGRALTRLWQEVRWRTPITDDEGELLMDIHLDLERAFSRDPEANIPWREWVEILTYLQDYYGYVEFVESPDVEPEIRTRATAVPAERPRIGYGRGRVQVSLTGGWSITVPGELAEEWEGDGQTWSAWYGGRSLWFTSWSVRRDDGETRSADDILSEVDLPDGEAYELREGDVVGRAILVAHAEDGHALWNFKAYSAVSEGFALCNFFLQDRDDVKWAVAVWQSLRH